MKVFIAPHRCKFHDGQAVHCVKDLAGIVLLGFVQFSRSCPCIFLKPVEADPLNGKRPVFPYSHQANPVEVGSKKLIQPFHIPILGPLYVSVHSRLNAFLFVSEVEIVEPGCILRGIPQNINDLPFTAYLCQLQVIVEFGRPDLYNGNFRSHLEDLSTDVTCCIGFVTRFCSAHFDQHAVSGIG